jgi:hypothetical protein
VRRHQCPYCACDRGDRLEFDPSAPFYGLVVEADRLIYADYISRRTATRCALKEAS